MVTVSISKGYSFLPTYLERREARRTLVEEMKEKIEDKPSQRYVIKGRELCISEISDQLCFSLSSGLRFWNTVDSITLTNL